LAYREPIKINLFHAFTIFVLPGTLSVSGCTKIGYKAGATFKLRIIAKLSFAIIKGYSLV
jgi:hypothetical protein